MRTIVEASEAVEDGLVAELDDGVDDELDDELDDGLVDGLVDEVAAAFFGVGAVVLSVLALVSTVLASRMTCDGGDGSPYRTAHTLPQ